MRGEEETETEHPLQDTKGELCEFQRPMGPQNSSRGGPPASLQVSQVELNGADSRRGPLPFTSTGPGPRPGRRKGVTHVSLRQWKTIDKFKNNVQIQLVWTWFLFFIRSHSKGKC